MTPVERRVARFMLDNPTKIINMPVKEIARHSDTSDAAIVRFSKRIGLAGIKELKVELAKELHTLEKESISRVIDVEMDSHKDIFDKVLKNTVQALYNTEKIVEREKMAGPPGFWPMLITLLFLEWGTQRMSGMNSPKNFIG